MQKVLDAEKRKYIIGILAIGGSRAMAAELLGCHPNTITNTANSDLDFAEKLRQAENSSEVRLLTTMAHAGNGVAHAAKWALERLYPDKYGRRKPGTYSVDAIKQLLTELATRLANAASNEDERTRSLNTMAQFGQELLLATEPFVEQAIPLRAEINALREHLNDANSAPSETQTQPDPSSNASTENPDLTQSITQPNPAHSPGSTQEHTHVQ
jgi:hypothetical protein